MRKLTRKVQICASIPATKPFFQRFLPRLLGSSLPTNSSVKLGLGTRDRDKSTVSSAFRSRPSNTLDVELAEVRGPFERLDAAGEEEDESKYPRVGESETRNEAKSSSTSDLSLSSFNFGPQGRGDIALHRSDRAWSSESGEVLLIQTRN